MHNRRIMLLGVWAIIAMIAMVIFIMLMIQITAPTGAYTQSAAYLQFEPNELCELKGCTLIQVINLPPKMGPSVDCLCNGEVQTFALFQPNLKEFPQYI